MLPNFDFMFLIDIDLISMMFEILLYGSSAFFGARLFENCQNCGFPDFEIYKNTTCPNVPGFFWIVLGILVSPKIKITVFLGLDTSTNSEIMEMRSCGFSNNKIGILLIQIEAE